jgi:serine/threonine protein phosphatase PrpC
LREFVRSPECESANDAARMLVKDAIARSGQDNTTAVIVGVMGS